MKRLFGILVLFGWTALAHADQPLKPNDFAHGIPIEIDGESSIYEVDLSLDLYRGIVRPDLGDVRVFNADGTVVPHMIVPGGATEEEMTANVGLTVFPLREGANQSADALSVMIRKGSDDSEVNVTADGRMPPSKRIVGYLLTATSVAGPLRTLIVDWSGAGDTFVLPATLEASDDLRSWRTVTDDAVIAQLAVEGEAIRKNRIEFPSAKASYWRLTLKDTGNAVPDLLIVGASAEYIAGTKSADREWLTVKGVASANQPRTYEFDLGARLPVDRTEVLLPEENQVISADLLTANTAEEPNKELQYSGVLYRLRQSGREMTSGPARPASGHDFAMKKLWFLRLRDDSTALDGAPPSLKVGWVPQKLVFVAQGKGPYLLAYGSGAAPKPRFEVENLFAENTGLERGTAKLKSPKTLGGLQKLLAPPPSPPSAREIWGKRFALVGMVLATLLLGWMAYRLARKTG